MHAGREAHALGAYAALETCIPTLLVRTAAYGCTCFFSFDGHVGDSFWFWFDGHFRLWIIVIDW